MKIKKKDLSVFVEYVCIFLMTINKPVPFDKIILLLYVIWKRKTLKHISKRQVLFFCLATLITSISFVINIPGSSVQIFYPILFLLAGVIISKRNLNLLYIRNIITVNIVFGIICACLATGGILNEYARTLYEKGFPFLYAPLGFSPTNQVYGTFCILQLMISYHLRKFDLSSVFAIIGLAMTMNRASWVFLICLWFWYQRKKLMLMAMGVFYLIITYWRDLQDIFDTGTISSRDELRKGVELAFWNSSDIVALLFGYGNFNTTEKIAAKTIHEQTYVENGLDFIAYCYGYLGLIFVACVILFYLYKRVKRRNWIIFSFLFTYLIFEQWLTQEFLASSFMFFFAIVLVIENDIYRQKARKKNKICRKTVEVENKPAT